MSWVLLPAAGLLDIVWAFTMKLSDGFARPGPSVVTLLAMLASVGLLSISMRTRPLGTAYMVWTGIGADRAGSRWRGSRPIKADLGRGATHSRV